MTKQEAEEKANKYVYLVNRRVVNPLGITMTILSLSIFKSIENEEYDVMCNLKEGLVESADLLDFVLSNYTI